jgi:hypothetical protein
MTTNTDQNKVALLLGAVALTTLAGGAFARSNEAPSAERPEFGILKHPVVIKVKPQNDLAAMDLFTSFQGDPTAGTAKMILVGTCKNLGAKTYQPGVRGVNIQRKQGNSWVTVQEKTLPALAAGKSVSVDMIVPANDTNSYRLQVSNGGPADENPGNDIFVPIPNNEVPR